MSEERGELSSKSAAILGLIARGHSYEQILVAHPDYTYLDIFGAAQEALDLVPSRETAEVVGTPSDVDRAITELLQPRDQLVVRMRLGLHDGKLYTLEEIGQHLDISRERVCRVLRSGRSGYNCDSLKHPVAGEGLGSVEYEERAMATFTAHILVGHAHPNHGGITPTHQLYLSENSRPAWLLTGSGVRNGASATPTEMITWIPTLENMLEDALLMIALHIVRDSAVTELAGRAFKSTIPDVVTLYKDIDRQDLDRLYERSRVADFNRKLVLTVLEPSTLIGRLGVLEKYRMDVEVCAPRYSRSYSRWQEEMVVRGSLDDLLPG